MNQSSLGSWWASSKHEQKQMIEDAVDAELSGTEDLPTDKDSFLRDAITHAYRGLFDMAAHDLGDLDLPETAWSDRARAAVEMVEGISGRLPYRPCAVT